MLFLSVSKYGDPLIFNIGGCRCLRREGRGGGGEVFPAHNMMLLFCVSVSMGVKTGLGNRWVSVSLGRVDVVAISLRPFCKTFDISLTSRSKPSLRGS